MSHLRHVTMKQRLVGAVAAAALALTGCADPDQGSQDSASRVVASVGMHDDVAALVPQAYRDKGYFTVGANSKLAPMMYVGADGKTMTGAEADLLRAIARVLGLEVRFHETTSDAFIPGILSRRFDASAGSVTDSKEREREVDFVVYAKYGQALITRAGEGRKGRFDALCGRSVAVLQGSVQQLDFLPQIAAQCKKRGKPTPVSISFPEGTQLFLAVHSGRVDTGFLNEVAVLYQSKQSNGQLVVSDRGYGTDPKGIVLPKSSPLRDAILGAVKVLAKDGTLDEIFSHWSIEETALPAPRVNAATR